MKGIINWFVLSNIFGDDFQLKGALIDNIKVEPLGGNLYIEFIIDNKVITPPKRWKHWDKVYLKIDFFFVKKLRWKIVNRHFIVKSISIQENQPLYIVIKDENGNILEFDFEAAQIQNIKPLSYNEKLGRYEVNAD